MLKRIQSGWVGLGWRNKRCPVLIHAAVFVCSPGHPILFYPVLYCCHSSPSSSSPPLLLCLFLLSLRLCMSSPLLSPFSFLSFLTLLTSRQFGDACERYSRPDGPRCVTVRHGTAPALSPIPVTALGAGTEVESVDRELWSGEERRAVSTVQYPTL
jgi:hypothetical protein